MIKKKNSVLVLAALGMLMSVSSCSKDEESINEEIDALKTVNQSLLGASDFIPNSGSLYHITSAENNRMVATNGNIFPFFNSGSFGEFADELRWEITPGDTDGQYFIDGVGGDDNPRLRSDDTSSPDMDPTTSIGELSQWTITTGGDNTYYLTTVGGTLNRLSSGRFGYMAMTTDDSETISEQFILTEITGNENRPPVANRDGGTHSVGETVVYDVLANDTDPDGDDLTVVNVFTNGNPNIVWDGGNTISVTRTSRFQSQVWYEISDGNGGTSQNFILLSNTQGNNG